jgi:hypothetical protein
MKTLLLFWRLLVVILVVCRIRLFTAKAEGDGIDDDDSIYTRTLDEGGSANNVNHTAVAAIPQPPRRQRWWIFHTRNPHHEENSKRRENDDADDPFKLTTHCRHNSSSIRRNHHRRWCPKMAYRMAVLSTLAYWEFHKSPMAATGFSVVSGETLLCRFWERTLTLLRNCNPHLAYLHTASSSRTTDTSTTTSCRHSNREKDFTFDYWLYDWFEQTSIPGVNFHDTDLLVSTSNGKKNANTLVLTFAGTASAADAFTSMQTFERANHSQFFGSVIQGTLHRGFLNAYSRVNRGSVLRILATNITTNNWSSIRMEKDEYEQSTSTLTSLDRRFRHCTKENSRSVKTNESVDDEQVDAADEEKDRDIKQPDNNHFTRKTKKGGCRVQGEKLMTILRELVTRALLHGKRVHISGHSLGGGLATLLALDIIINFPHVPISRLHLWTFGAPQVADDLFLRSAIDAAPRLGKFLRGRYHRFVTLSDHCEVDIVSEVTKNALEAGAARRLGGVRHGHSVVHFTEPHYLFTPDQWNDNDAAAAPAEQKGSSSTRSAVAAHATINYLQGISRESNDHPLATDLPANVAEWLLGGMDVIRSNNTEE